MSSPSSSSAPSASPPGSVSPNDNDIEYIRPLLPTILGDLPSLPIPGTDLIFASIEGGFVFPGTVSRTRLTTALARTLQYYPHGAGRLLQDPETNIWRVELLNAPVALSFATAPADFDSTDAARYVDRDPTFVDLVSFGFAPTSSETEPVVKLKVVYYPLTGDSSVFLSWCHALGDGTTAYGFLHTLSRLYHNLPPVHIPTYEKYLSTPPPPLERHLLHTTLNEVPHLAMDYDAQTFFGMYGRMLGETERVDLHFGERELEGIREAARRGSKKGGEYDMEISKRDALSGYMITVLNRVVPETPVNRIMNVVDFRGAPVSSSNPTYRAPSRTAAGNLTLTHFIDIPSSSNSPSSTLSLLAQTIHTSVATLRTNGEHVRRVVSLSEELYARSTARGRLQWWFPYVPGEGFDEDEARKDSKTGVTVAINNLSNVDFPAIHFAETSSGTGSAAPIRSRFYTFDSWAHYLRIWKGNPLPVYDGEADADASSSTSTSTFPAGRPSSPTSNNSRIIAWKAEPHSLRVFFRVRNGRKALVEEIVKRDMANLLSGKGLGAEVIGEEEESGGSWFGFGSGWKGRAKAKAKL